MTYWNNNINFLSQGCTGAARWSTLPCRCWCRGCTRGARWTSRPSTAATCWAGWRTSCWRTPTPPSAGRSAPGSIDSASAPPATAAQVFFIFFFQKDLENYILISTCSTWTLNKKLVILPVLKKLEVFGGHLFSEDDYSNLAPPYWNITTETFSLGRTELYIYCKNDQLGVLECL